MGTATRVRVIFEFRNGDGHFHKEGRNGKYVRCSGEADASALEAAFLLAIQEHEERLKRVQEIRKQMTPANHD